MTAFVECFYVVINNFLVIVSIYHIIVLTENICPDLMEIDNGGACLNRKSATVTATYLCNHDFDLRGVSTLICEDNGEWSSEFPICTRK